jgi:hypothetical protein
VRTRHQTVGLVERGQQLLAETPADAAAGQSAQVAQLRISAIVDARFRLIVDGGSGICP